MVLTILAHHSEPGDPVLLEWIRHQIDAILGLGPGAIVLALGLVIIAIPLAILAVFLAQRARQSRTDR
jgi:4-amino-4-deoxy-L-arabinose transferase-like glycosyltransferase